MRGNSPRKISVHFIVWEAFVNALIHADYSGSGKVVLEHITDFFNFSNPGKLLLS